MSAVRCSTITSVDWRASLAAARARRRAGDVCCPLCAKRGRLRVRAGFITINHGAGIVCAPKNL